MFPKTVKDDPNRRDELDKILELDMHGLPYQPSVAGADGTSIGDRNDNPVVYLDLAAMGGRKLSTGQITTPTKIGRLYFELRRDIVPVAATNFLLLCSGDRGVGDHDGVNYTYKGTKIHRIVKHEFFQGGDLQGLDGECSRSVYDQGKLFRDENFLLRHTGPGCLSLVNRGPDSNGSLFQVVMLQSPRFDERQVVFGCLASDACYDCLSVLNDYGTMSGKPVEEIRIVDCGVAFTGGGLGGGFTKAKEEDEGEEGEGEGGGEDGGMR